MALLVRECGITETTKILDVGGLADFWDHSPVSPRVTILNLSAPADVIADAQQLPFKNNAFDIVFSNSVIEHVGCVQNQESFAEEISRVGAKFIVQTPNRWFPLELHTLILCLHWLPRHIFRRIAPLIWLNAMPGGINDLRLLSAADLRTLFPGARIIRERFLCWTKSLIAVDPPQ